MLLTISMLALLVLEAISLNVDVAYIGFMRQKNGENGDALTFFQDIVLIILQTAVNGIKAISTIVFGYLFWKQHLTLDGFLGWINFIIVALPWIVVLVLPFCVIARILNERWTIQYSSLNYQRFYLVSLWPPRKMVKAFFIALEIIVKAPSVIQRFFFGLVMVILGGFPWLLIDTLIAKHVFDLVAYERKDTKLEKAISKSFQ